MISSKSDYKYVTGLDDIIIDGQILPLRNDAADKTPLRGEDIAFLIEAGKDRIDFRQCGNSSQSIWKFNKKITAAQQNFVVNSSYAGTNLIKPNASWPIKMYTGESYPSLYDVYPDNFTSCTYPEQVASGEKLNINPISEAFSNIEKQNRYNFWANNYGAYSYERTSYIEDHSEGSAPWSPGAPSGECYYHYYYVDGTGQASGSATFKGSKAYSVTNPRAGAIHSGVAHVTVDYWYVERPYGGEEGEEINLNKTFFVPVVFSKGYSGAFVTNISQIYDKAPTMLAMMGVSAKDYSGGRSGRVQKIQSIRIYSRVAYAILEIDNRTRW